MTDVVVPFSERTVTDIIPLAGFLTYFLVYPLGMFHIFKTGDINRVIYETDSCGNICGLKNEPHPDFPCKGKDMTGRMFAMYPLQLHDPKRCVISCNVTMGYRQVRNKCFPSGEPPMYKNIQHGYEVDYQLDNFFEDVGDDLVVMWKVVILGSGISCLITLLVGILAIMYPRGYVKTMLRTPYLAGGLLIFLGLLGVILYSKDIDMDSYDEKVQESEDDTEKLHVNDSMIFTLFATLPIVIGVCMIGCNALAQYIMKKYIAVMVALIAYGAKCIRQMPEIVIISVVIASVMVCYVVLWTWMFLWMLSAGHYVKNEENVLELSKDGITVIMIMFHVFGFVWMMAFLSGMIQVIMSGAVSRWYFTRDQTKLHATVCVSIATTFKYHIGTIAFSSLILALIQLCIHRQDDNDYEGGYYNHRHHAERCWGEACERLLNYLGSVCYIETAIYGTNLFGSGKRGVEILFKFWREHAAIALWMKLILYITSRIIGVLTMFVMTIIVLNIEGLNYPFLILVGVMVFAALVSSHFTYVMDAVVLCMVMCYCEDINVHDGANKPYYMPGELQTTMESMTVICKNEFEEAKEKYQLKMLNAATRGQGFV